MEANGFAVRASVMGPRNACSPFSLLGWSPDRFESRSKSGISENVLMVKFFLGRNGNFMGESKMVSISMNPVPIMMSQEVLGL